MSPVEALASLLAGSVTNYLLNLVEMRDDMRYNFSQLTSILDAASCLAAVLRS